MLLRRLHEHITHYAVIAITCCHNKHNFLSQKHMSSSYNNSLPTFLININVTLKDVKDNLGGPNNSVTHNCPREFSFKG